MIVASYERDPGKRRVSLPCRAQNHRINNTGHHYYAHLYWGQALYQRGGKDWDTYYKSMAAWLMKQQSKDGSWQGDGVGTVYGTGIALTILQLPYAYAPIYQR